MTPALAVRPVRLLLALLAVSGLLLLAFAPAAGAFSDVSSGHRYYDAIQDLSTRGIINGYPDGSFGPDKPVWRQHFAKMIVLSLDLPVSEADVCRFNDVEKGGNTDPLYPDNYIAVAASNGITTGKTATTFAPTENISRAQVLTMVTRAMDGLWPEALLTPPPGFASTWGGFSTTHAENARRAEYNKLFSGMPLGQLDAWGGMPRAEVAQVLYNALSYKLPHGTITLQGSGAPGGQVVTVDKWPGPALAYVEGDGTAGYFGVTGEDASGGWTADLVSATQPYEGIVPLDFGDTVTAGFRIDAPGPWKIELRGPDTARVLTTPGSISGSGPEVVAVVGRPANVSITGNPSGVDHFHVRALGADAKNLVLTNGPYSGSAPVGDIAFIAVDAVGAWSITAGE